MNNHFYYLNRIAVAFSFIILFLNGCNNPQKTSSHSGEETETGIISKEYTTRSGQIFILTEDKSQGASINKVKISTRKFENANEEFILGEIDPVETVFLADLDQNGYDELYFTIRSAGSGSYSWIYGFVSNNDKSVSSIYVPDISEVDLKSGGMFDGYMGHNSFIIENGVLVNNFPVYHKNDTNASPSGEHRKIRYTLIPGEAGWMLKPIEKIKQF